MSELVGYMINVQVTIKCLVKINQFILANMYILRHDLGSLLFDFINCFTRLVSSEQIFPLINLESNFNFDPTAKLD